jgi:methylenetetrahydrofolate dehydrogenase (NADP+)/methenyltetrahydrofolate cyclohydrolase
MGALIIDGKKLAGEMRAEAKLAVEALAETGCTPTLASVRIGDDESTTVYVRQQQRTCERLGIEYLATQMPSRSSERAVCTMIDSLNANPDVHGIILQLPLPEALSATRIQRRIRPEKDVEGVHPENVGRLVYHKTDLAPCTAKAVMALIQTTETDLKGAEAVIVGAGAIAGKPISLLLQSEMCTTTLCHIDTRDLVFHTRRADILVVAVGKPSLITGDMIRPGAIVIDVGINTVDALDAEGRPIIEEDGTTCKTVVGDVEAEGPGGALDVAGHLTPVPGGVGPVTVAVLMQNIAQATRLQCESGGRDLS